MSLSSLLLLSNMMTAAASDIPVISNTMTDLTYDANNRLSSYYLVFPEADIANNCPSIKTDHYGVQVTALKMDSPAMAQVFPEYDESILCHAAILERGAQKEYAGYPMPHKIYNGPANNYKEFDAWFSEHGVKLEVCLMNYSDKTHPLHNYWIPDDGREPQFNQELKYGERNTRCFFSFLGHKFQVQHSQTKQVLAEFTIEFPLLLGIGKSESHGQVYQEGEFDNQIRSTLRNEWTKKDMPKRTFSPLGFAKGRLPNDVFAAMGAFYYNNQYHKTNEEWKGKGVFVNWWETDVFMIQIPWKMKDKWQQRLVDLVNEWSGIKVEQTVMYGLRQYEEGARLLTHVDRLNTHVLSLIVNVAQGGLEEDWPVEVFDHNGRLHEVIMEPGGEYCDERSEEHLA